MSKQDIKTEEKFMSHNAWFSIFMGVTLLIISVYPMLKQTSAPLLFIGGTAFLGSFFMFVIRGGFTWKLGYRLTYKDEFLNMDVPFSKQSPKVKTILKKLLVEGGTQKMEKDFHDRYGWSDPRLKKSF